MRCWFRLTCTHLHGINAFGTRLSFYKYNLATHALRPNSIPTLHFLPMWLPPGRGTATGGSRSLERSCGEGQSDTGAILMQNYTLLTSSSQPPISSILLSYVRSSRSKLS